MSASIVTIYTDGGCDPNPGRGGWAAILQQDGKTVEISGCDVNSTNNRMELTAAIQGLKALKEPSTVTLYTDSTYVQKGMTEWMPGWLRKNWRGSSGPVLNVDLWKELLDAAKPHKVTWQWVKGHSSNRFNARADELVHRARNK
jgi:ribonuclease HI